MANSFANNWIVIIMNSIDVFYSKIIIFSFFLCFKGNTICGGLPRCLLRTYIRSISFWVIRLFLLYANVQEKNTTNSFSTCRKVRHAPDMVYCEWHWKLPIFFLLLKNTQSKHFHPSANAWIWKLASKNVVFYATTTIAEVYPLNCWMALLVSIVVINKASRPLNQFIMDFAPTTNLDLCGALS